MNAIDIEGIMSAIREDHRDKLNVSALADYLEEQGDTRASEFVRKYLSSRNPMDVYGDGQHGWWNRNEYEEFIDSDDLPHWLWDRLSAEDTDDSGHPSRKLYPNETCAYTRLFDALLKGDK